MSQSRFNQTGPKIGLSVRLAETQEEIEAAQRLRYRVFYEEMSAVPTGTVDLAATTSPGER